MLDHDHSITEKRLTPCCGWARIFAAGDSRGSTIRRLVEMAHQRFPGRRPFLAHKPNYRQDSDDLMFAEGVVYLAGIIDA